MDEKALSEKIRDYLNRTSINSRFKFVDSFCDLIDEKNGVYIEVKADHFAPAQLLHAIAKQRIKDSKYLGVTDGKEVRLYRPPPYGEILSFAKSFDPTLVFSASQADKPELNSKAEEILGSPQQVIPIEFDPGDRLFVSVENMDSVRFFTDKYRIHLDLLLAWLDGVGEEDVIKVNPSGFLVNTDNGFLFTNEYDRERRRKELGEFDGGYRRPKYVSIRPADRPWFESLRVKHEDLADVLHEVDRLLPRKKRREGGVFWTESEIGDKLAGEIMGLTKPEFVVEPCVGGGSLIKDIVPKTKGTMNDISDGHVENCRKIFDGYDWKFTTLDVVSTDTTELVAAWGIKPGERLLLYTNPPFGTSSTSKIVSKKGEMGERSSRQHAITYPPVLLKYGKGDLFMPIVGRLIEVAKSQKSCYLAFFAPFGLFCGRKRYLNLYGLLLKDFTFVRGYVFGGENFHDINATKPIALSIWKHVPNMNTKRSDLVFDFLEKGGAKKKLQFKEMRLLKDGWRYRDGSKYVKVRTRDAIDAPRCDLFNVPNVRIIGVGLKEGSGAEISPDNLKLDKVVLCVPGVPPELLYGLWSVSVGNRTFNSSMSSQTHPIYFDNAYVHLPDFNNQATLEILAYAILEVLLKNYAEDRIGFFGTNRVFRFGNERLTKGAEYIIGHCKDAPTYDGGAIGDAFELIRHSKVDVTKLRRSLKEEVAKRLESIGYWDYIPIPRTTDTGSSLDGDFSDSGAVSNGQKASKCPVTDRRCILRTFRRALPFK